MNSTPDVSPDSQAQLLVKQSAPAYRLAMRVLGSSGAAEDIVQQAFVVAMERLRSGNPPENPATWFLGVVANQARMHRRKNTVRSKKEVTMDFEPADAAPPDRELAGALAGAMAMLEEEYRLAVSLCCEEGLTQEQAAAVLGVSQSTLSRQVRSGLAKLRRAMTDAGYAVTAAALFDGLRQNAPAVPASLTARVEALAAAQPAPAGAAATGPAAVAAKSGLAAKLIAGIILVGAAVGAATVASSLLGGRRSGIALPGADGGRLLLGFEKEEVERIAAAFPQPGALRNAGGRIMQLSPPQTTLTGAAMAGISPMELVGTDATQGEYALKVPNTGSLGQLGEAYLYSSPQLQDLGLANDPRANLRLPEVFNTGGWFADAFPADWSEWDVLRLDVRAVHERPVTLLVEIEDQDVEPPVSRTYSSIAPGSWVTLELDLRNAVRERGLDLTKMCNLFVRFDSREELSALGALRNIRNQPGLESTEVYLDNIRLCRRDAACALPVRRGERSSYTLALPRSYAAEVTWHGNSPARGGRGATISDTPVVRAVAPAAGQEDMRLSSPSVIDLPPLLAKGYAPDTREGVTPENLHEFVVLRAITAAGANAMLVCFGTPALPFEMRFDQLAGFGAAACPMAAVVTTDGGRTWGGFKGPGEVPTYLHKGRGAWEGSVFDAGTDLMGLHDDGCLTFRGAYEWYPADRTFLWRTVYADGAWKMSPLLFVSGDLRWCSHASQSILQLPSGRIWCAWNGRGRRGEQAWAKYSDDGGVTWHGWRGDTLVSAVPLRGQLFPYGEGVGMIADKGRWTVFDGRTWTEPAPTPAIDPVQAVACGTDIYVIDRKGPLAWCDGATWRSLDLPGREDYPRSYRRHGNGPGDPEWVGQQHFSVCGDTVLFTEPDVSGRKLLCWRRPAGGAWTGPQELVSEETPIADVAAPRYIQTGFAPVAYNCWGDDGKRITPAEKGKRPAGRDLKPWIKVITVPALDNK